MKSQHGPTERRGCVSCLTNPIVASLLVLLLVLVIAGGFLIFKVTVLDVRQAQSLKARIDADLSQLGSALRNYEARTGEYPDRLSEMAGITWEGPLPVDPFSPFEEPYVYEKVGGGGFVLVYSVGPDGEPNQGMRDVTHVVEPEDDNYGNAIAEYVQIDRAQENPDNRIDLIMRALQQVNRNRESLFSGVGMTALDIIVEEGWDSASLDPGSATAARRLKTGGYNPWRPGMPAQAIPAATEIPDPRPIVRDFMEKSRGAIEMVHEGVAAASTGFVHREGELCAYTPIINFLSAQVLGKLLVGEGKRLEFEGQPAEAADRYLDTIGLGRVMGTGAMLISDLIGIALTNMGTHALQKMLREGVLGEEELAQVLVRLEEEERRYPHLSESFLVEHEAFRGSIEDMITWPREDFRDLGMGPEGRLMHLYLLLNSERIIENNRMAMTEIAAVIEGEKEEPTFDLSSTDYINRIAVPNYLNAGIRESVMVADLRGARIAAALELYRLRNGQYPEGLDALEDILGELPADPYGEEPFAYEKTEEGYALWSIGPDENDDGAGVVYDPTNGTISAGDVVMGR